MDIENFNKPIKLIYQESRYALEKDKAEPCLKIMIYEDGRILRKEYQDDGTFKEVKIHKSNAETRDLFTKVYGTVRNDAWELFKMLDDYSIMLKIVYPCGHYEVINLGAASTKDNMIAELVTNFAYDNEMNN